MVNLGEWVITGVFILLAYIRLVVLVCSFLLFLVIAGFMAITVISWFIRKMKPHFGSRVVEKEQNVKSIS